MACEVGRPGGGGRNFCGAIKEFAQNLGKNDFFLVGEIAGGDYNEDRYLDVLGRNLNAALDIGEMRPTLGGVAKGLVDPRANFSGFEGADIGMGSHRNLGLRHVSILQQAGSPNPATYSGPHALGSTVPVHRHSSGAAFVEIRDIAPSEVIVLANHP